MKKKPLNRIPSLPPPPPPLLSSPPSPLPSSLHDVVLELVMVPSLPTDLIINILLRLPVKSLEGCWVSQGGLVVETRSPVQPPTGSNSNNESSWIVSSSNQTAANVPDLLLEWSSSMASPLAGQKHLEFPTVLELFLIRVQRRTINLSMAIRRIRQCKSFRCISGLLELHQSSLHPISIGRTI